MEVWKGGGGGRDWLSVTCGSGFHREPSSTVWHCECSLETTGHTLDVSLVSRLRDFLQQLSPAQMQIAGLDQS